MLSVRVDSIDRRLAQLEAVERRMSELSITNPQLNDFSRLQQRVTDLEQIFLTSGTDSGAVNVDGHGTDGDRLDVVHSVTKGVDTLTKQMNNLTARMTLAENQLMLQVLFILHSYLVLTDIKLSILTAIFQVDLG